MEYQKKVKAGLINQNEIADTQRRLQCVIASLKNTNIINPFAPLIHLPEDVPHPRKTLLLLIRFIDSDGRRYGDFLDEKGKYIGNDGIDDGKVYVVKTTEKSFDSGVSSAGISKSDAKSTENFIAKNSGNTEAFQNNSIAEEWKPTTSRQKTWILTAKPFLSIREKATKTALYR
jgi:hypothetical protein